ncbi:hypothetical protein L596_026835 [Steinernema carpocapsae]|uniref:Serpentine receptor class gamma n=1 Tax=Steinernema carpocapsae TaxID=34508 RepID=A0A4U5M2I3_STECR|nr:hypothetical protein L596_026835 [Steinernema carpocapsae]
MQTYLVLIYISAYFNLIVNCFTLYIVFKHTPPNMKNVAACVLNIILWNFAGNIMWALIPFYPLFPMNCYQLIGPLAVFFKHYYLAKYCYIILVLFFLNVNVGVQLSFQFRWIQIAAPDRIKNLGKKWAYAYSAGIHFLPCALFSYLSHYMFLTPEEYPDFDPVYKGVPIYCLTPDQHKLTVLVSIIVAFVILSAMVIIALIILSYTSLNAKRQILSANTLKLQKTYLRNLIILASISIVLGMVGGTVAWFCYYSHMVNLKLLCMGAILVVLNHGTVLDVATLVVFRPYRKATQRVVRYFFYVCGVKNVLLVSTVTRKPRNLNNSGGHAARI